MKRAFVIGHPISHSRSPLIHGYWLDQLRIQGSYERIDVPPADLPAFVRSFSERGYVGGNVTVPHKHSAYGLVAEASPSAERLHAVNTLSLGPGGRLRGDNTDGFGFLAGLDAALGPGWRAEARVAIVLGAGGAARAIVGALLDIGLKRVVVVNRTEERARSLLAREGVRVAAVSWDDLESALPSADLLVNATTLGMAGQPDLVVSIDKLPARAVVSDIVYVPLVTPLLAAARSRGLRTADGLGMLLHQAVPGFAAWFGTTPNVTHELRQLVEADIERRT